jgi:hypothetical protein
MLISASYLASLPWQNFKSQQLNTYELQPVVDSESSSEVWRGLSLPDPVTVFNYYDVFSPEPSYAVRYLIYLSLSNENKYYSYRENNLFLNWMLDHRSKGTYLVSAGWYPFTINSEEVQPYNTLSFLIPGTDNSTFINVFSQLLYQLIALAFLVSITLALLRKEYYLFLLLAIAAISAVPYLFVVPVDRYSISIYPLMASLLVLFILFLFESFSNSAVRKNLRK